MIVVLLHLRAVKTQKKLRIHQCCLTEAFTARIIQTLKVRSRQFFTGETVKTGNHSPGPVVGEISP